MYQMKNLFAGKAADALRVLLVSYPKTWSLRELCKEANISLRWASMISDALIRERIALRGSPRSELKIMDPYGLLKRWASFNNFSANTRFIEYYTQEENITKFFGQFKEKDGPRYAFTSLAGALLVAAYVRPTNVHLYVESEEDARKWAGMLDLLPVEEHGNVKFAIPESQGVFYGEKMIDNVHVVSDIQLYVDLLNYPARGEEAAEAIYKVIEKRWRTVG